LAICAAVFPLPYFFDWSDLPAVCAVAAFDPLDVHVALEPVPPPVEHCVGLLPFAVLLSGLTPGCAPAFWSTVAWLAEAELDLSWPLALPCPALAELDLSWPLALPCPALAEVDLSWPLPCPFPARADPAKAARPQASKRPLIRLAIRFVISFLLGRVNTACARETDQ
jgi:hypothetical protein